jgi:NAD(P)-dependent dehydrogenase (short-subunit alcohol dehydrogenase family)
MILHSLLQDQNQADLKQFILVGSSVAESQSDPKASSYSAAKHALWGLYKTVIKENPQIDLRLFSPPYMETDMLPLHSEPRQSGKAWAPEKISSIMLEWIQDCNKTLDHYKF